MGSSHSSLEIRDCDFSTPSISINTSSPIYSIINILWRCSIMILLVNLLTLIPFLILIFSLSRVTSTQLINYLVFSNIYTTILLAIEPKKPLLIKRFFGFYIIHISTYIFIALVFFNTYSPVISITNILLNFAFFNIIFIIFNGLPFLFKYSQLKDPLD